MEIDDRILTEPDEEALTTPTTTTVATKTPIPRLMDIPMPPPKQPLATPQTTPPNKAQNTTDDDSYLSASSTDQEDLRQKLKSKATDIRETMEKTIMITTHIIVREKATPEGKLYPDMKDTECEEIILGTKSFHNSYKFHLHLQKAIRIAVENSPQSRQMTKDGHIALTRDKATYRTLDRTNPNQRIRYTKLYPVTRNHDYPNKYQPDINDKHAHVLVKVDIFPDDRDKTSLAKRSANIRQKEDLRQFIENDKRKEKEDERNAAIKRLTERSQKAGEKFLVLEPALIQTELEAMRAEKDQEDEACKRNLEDRIQQVLKKREEEQKKAHAIWIQKQKEKQSANKAPTTTDNTPERQPKTTYPFSLFPSHNMAVKNAMNALKTLAAHDTHLPDSELTFKLKLAYQEFLIDSATPEHQVPRRTQLQYVPRHITNQQQRKRMREDDEEPPRYPKPNRPHNMKQHRPTPSNDDWTSPAPKDWREVNRRHLEEAKLRLQQQTDNDSDWD